MTAFTHIDFNLADADRQLNSFRDWLHDETFVGEAEIVAQIKQRPHMACLLASTLGLEAPDLIRFELALKGMFRTDLVLGNQGTRRFGLIEFEDATEHSIFKKGAAQYRQWAPRIEHGFQSNRRLGMGSSGSSQRYRAGERLWRSYLHQLLRCHLRPGR